MSPEAPPHGSSTPGELSAGGTRNHGTDPLKTMPLLQHLEELRSTLFSMLIVTVVAAVGAWFVSEPILDILVTSDLGAVHYFGPTEGFMIRLKVSLVAGLLVALPILLARLWQFVAPGLFKSERRVVQPVLLASTSLFYFGVLFAYVGVVPKTISFFLSFAGERLVPMINVTQYFMFVAKFCLAFGVVFQLPLVIVLLSALGLVSPARLWRTWRYGIIVIFIFAAWLTPPDAVSQAMMAGPIVVLYLLSIALAFVFARKRRKQD